MRALLLPVEEAPVDPSSSSSISIVRLGLGDGALPVGAVVVVAPAADAEVDVLDDDAATAGDLALGFEVDAAGGASGLGGRAWRRVSSRAVCSKALRLYLYI